MTTITTLLDLLNQIKAETEDLIGSIRIVPVQIATRELAEICDNMGVIQAGEFRTGNGVEPGFGFSGVRIAYPALVYDGIPWNFAGVDSDDLQVGIRAADGVLMAGGGNTQLSAQGLTMYTPTSTFLNTNAVKWSVNSDFSDPFATLGSAKLGTNQYLKLDMKNDAPSTSGSADQFLNDLFFSVHGDQLGSDNQDAYTNITARAGLPGMGADTTLYSEIILDNWITGVNQNHLHLYSSPASASASIELKSVGRILLDAPDIHMTGYTRTYESPGTFCARLTPTTGSPVVIADATAVTNLYLTPYKGNVVSLYDSDDDSWLGYELSEITIPLNTTGSGTNYDVYLYNDSGLTTELIAWSDASTRATIPIWQGGVWVHPTNLGHRYVGSFRTTGTAGQTEFSFQPSTSAPRKLFVWNAYNRHRFAPFVSEPAATWVIPVGSRQVNGNSINQIEIISGMLDNVISLDHEMYATSGSVAGSNIKACIGKNSTTIQTARTVNGTINTTNTLVCHLSDPPFGYNYYCAIDAAYISSGSGYGNTNDQFLVAEWEC